jgi:hypothetical protein
MDEYSKVLELADQLTDEEFLFCEEYLKNITAPVALSVVRALPYEEMPHRKAECILHNPKVRDYLDVRRKIIRRTYITKDDVLLRIMNTLDKCTQPVAVLDKLGHPTGEYTMDSKGATKLLEMLAKHFGIVETGKQSNESDSVSVAPKVSVNKDDLNAFIDKFNAEY